MKPEDWRRLLLGSAAGVLLYFTVGLLGPLHPGLGLQVRPQLVVLVVAAATLGPLEGVATGLLGELWLGLATGAVWWSVALAAGFIGFAMGWFCHTQDIAEGWFSGSAARKLVLVALPVNLAAWLLVCPALDLLLYREALDNFLLRGLREALLGFLLCAVAGTLLLALVARVCRRLPWGRSFAAVGAAGTPSRQKKPPCSGGGTGNGAAGTGAQDVPESIFDYEWEP